MILETLKHRFKDIDKNIAPLNEKICNHLSLFIKDENILAASLIQNPYSETQISPGLVNNFGEEVPRILETLNRMHNLDEELVENFLEYKPIIIIFIINYKFLFEEKDISPQAKEALTIEKINYANKFLEKLDVGEIRSELEDQFFSFLEPKIFNHYYELLKFTQKNYQEKEKLVCEKIQNVLESTGANVEIESRLKSIYSIHKKITKKKILYSQVLDTIGLRILVDSEKDCYQIMGLILKNWPIINNKIKDFIAVPKRNGYQSIHLTILEKGYPVEIQIRTKEMHHFAQYGLAAHHQYKAAL